MKIDYRAFYLDIAIPAKIHIGIFLSRSEVEFINTRVINEIFVPFLCHIYDFAKFLVSSMRLSNLVFVKYVAPDIPEHLWIISEEVLDNEFIKANQLLAQYWIIFPQTICPSKCRQLVTLVRLAIKLAIRCHSRPGCNQ